MLTRIRYIKDGYNLVSSTIFNIKSIDYTPVINTSDLSFHFRNTQGIEINGQGRTMRDTKLRVRKQLESMGTEFKQEKRVRKETDEN